ncbi:MAG: S8 family serine peptidase [Bacteroidota bacterium]
MFRRLNAVLLFVLMGISTYAAGTSLLLRNGPVDMPDNAQEFIQEFQPSSSELYMGRYYLVIRFAETPMQEVQNSIKGMGIRLLEYLPYNAYVASIPQSFDLQRLVNAGVKAFMRPGHELKLSPELYTMQVPAHAQYGNEVEVRVRLYSDVEKSRVIDWIASRYNIVDEYPHPTLTTLRAHPMRLMELYAQPFVQFIEPAPMAPTPDDTEGRSLHRSNVINSDYGAGRKYDGTGISVGLADDGNIGPHIDYTGRLTQFSTSNGGSHGDMTAGIMFGAGNRDPQIRGHATGAYMYYWSISGYVHIVNGMQHYSNYGLVLTSTSYSQGTGGVYTSDAQFIDNQIATNPQMIHVFSAGNAGTSNHGYGAGAGWGNITGGYKAAKHVVTCGNLRDQDQLENSSSRGPADDGRIKPDICANGYQQNSTAENNSNQVGGGTSAAAPSVAGTITQLMHAYKALNNGQEPDAYLIKAAALNTAEDLGNAGPDYQFGWGRINALRAVRILENNQYVNDQVTNGQTKTHTITVPAGTGELRVMCYWLDPAGSPSAAVALVNDLTLTVTDPGQTTYNCWKLDPTPNVANLNAPAVRGLDSLNTMEQVTLNNPAAGTYTISVEGASVPNGPQEYYVVYEMRQQGVEVTYPLGGEGLDPGTTEKIRWDASGVTGTFTVEYSTNNGSNWTTISNNVNNGLRTLNWNVPNAVTGQALVRVTNGSFNDVSDANFSIINVPSGLNIDYVCPDSIGFSWNAVSGATGYEVSMLGMMYMDSIGTTSATNFTIYGQNPNLSHWFSVRALGTNNAAGQRAIAIEQPPGTVACVIPTDVSVEAVVSPGGSYLPECQASATMPVTVDVRNMGTNPVSNIGISYSFNGGAPVTETIAGPIAPGTTIQHTFASTVNLGTVGNYTLDSWTTLTGDGNIYNDSANTSTTVASSVTVNLPYSEDFEGFSNCNTSSNCEATSCNLGNGWVNPQNLVVDDIDWRVDNGGTPSNNTGPSVDHDPGNASGKYIYTEASGGCEDKVATLISPCLDLNNVNSPELSFWYHMRGTDMGSLHLDILVDGEWNDDVILPIQGNQGNSWQNVTFNLSPYIGKLVNFRIRGITGPGFTSDIAIDDIQVTTASAAPAAQFVGSPTLTCVGNTVIFTDQSSNAPTGWNWSISPNNFVFVNGTSASSQNPEVQFSATGLYTVTMTASNIFGSDTYSISAYIDITAGATAPLVEGFQGAFLPQGWSIVDPGGSNTWAQATNITGSNGNPTNAAFVENYVYNSPGAEDELLSLPIDLTTANGTAQMTFDVAYAQFNANLFDELRIDVSTDCGATFSPSTYSKSGPTLATAPDNTSNWAPTSVFEWRNDLLDLTPYIGSSIVVKFVNVNGYGNNLYLDNINIDLSVANEQELSQGQVQLYPNPNDGAFTLSVDQLPAGPASITVHDLAGRQVFNQAIEGQGGRYESRLQMEALPQGVYYLHLEATDLKVVRKLVIK